MSKRDYYEVLGVEKGSADQDIKKAFRRTAMKYHPDRNPDDKNADEKFKEAQEAYEVLGDPEKKAAYDRLVMQVWTNNPGVLEVQGLVTSLVMSSEIYLEEDGREVVLQGDQISVMNCSSV